MIALAALRRDVRALTPSCTILVVFTPLGAVALACIAVFPARFFA